MCVYILCVCTYVCVRMYVCVCMYVCTYLRTCKIRTHSTSCIHVRTYTVYVIHDCMYYVLCVCVRTYVTGSADGEGWPFLWHESSRELLHSPELPGMRCVF